MPALGLSHGSIVVARGVWGLSVGDSISRRAGEVLCRGGLLGNEPAGWLRMADWLAGRHDMG